MVPSAGIRKLLQALYPSAQRPAGSQWKNPYGSKTGSKDIRPVSPSFVPNGERSNVRIIPIGIIYQIAINQYGEATIQGRLVVVLVVDSSGAEGFAPPHRDPEPPDTATLPSPGARPPAPQVPSVPSRRPSGAIPIRAMSPALASRVREDLDLLPPEIRDSVRSVDVRYVDGRGRALGYTPKNDAARPGKSPVTIDYLDYLNNPREGRKTVWHEGFHTFTMDKLFPAMEDAERGVAMTAHDRQLAKIGFGLRASYDEALRALERRHSSIISRIPYMNADQQVATVERLWKEIGQKYFPSLYAFDTALQHILSGKTDESYTTGLMEFTAEAFSEAYDPGRPGKVSLVPGSSFLAGLWDLVSQLASLTSGSQARAA